MPTTEPSITVRESGTSPTFSGARVGADEVAATTLMSIRDFEQPSDPWSRIVDEKLIKWAADDHFLDDDGFEPPTSDSIARSAQLVKYMRERDFPLPTGVIPNGEGGIVFENRCDPAYQRLEIDETGRIELLMFENCELRNRAVIGLE